MEGRRAVREVKGAGAGIEVEVLELVEVEVVVSVILFAEGWVVLVVVLLGLTSMGSSTW